MCYDRWSWMEIGHKWRTYLRQSLTKETILNLGAPCSKSNDRYTWRCCLQASSTRTHCSGLSTICSLTAMKRLSTHCAWSWAFPSWPIVPSTGVGLSAKVVSVAFSRSAVSSAPSTKLPRKEKHRRTDLPSYSKMQHCSSTWQPSKQVASLNSSLIPSRWAVKHRCWKTWSVLKAKLSSALKTWTNLKSRSIREASNQTISNWVM